MPEIIPPIVPPEKPVAATMPPKGADGKFVSVRESMGIRTKKPKEDKPQIAPKVEKKPKPVIAPASPSPIIDAEQIASAVETGVKRGMTPAELPAPKDESESLTPEMKRKYLTLERMAKNNASMAEKPKQFLESVKKLETYKAEWLAKNKGKTFSLDDDEHAEFLQGNDVSWDDDEYVEALAELKAEGIINKVEKKFEGKLSEIEKRERARNAVPEVNAHMKTTAKVLFNELGAEFERVLDASGTFNPVEMRALIEKNPVYEDLLPIAQHTEEVAGEIYRIANGLSQFSETNPVHREIIGFATSEEKRLRSQPADKQLNAEGKVFATSDEWEKLKPAEQKSRWHFTDKDLSALYAFSQAKRAKEIIKLSNDRVEKTIKARGLKPADVQNGASWAGAKRLERAEEAKEIERTPSGTVAPRMTPAINRSQNDKRSIRDKILGR
jgi:hypothetical protein